MSLHRAEFRPPHDEPAVQHPALRVMVEAARTRPAPRVGLDAEALHAAWAQQRARRRTRVGVGLAMAAAILLAIGLTMPSSGSHEVDSGRAPALDSIAKDTPPSGPRIDPPVPGSDVVPSPSMPEAPPRLAARIEVSPLGDAMTDDPSVGDPSVGDPSAEGASVGDDAPSPEILGSHRLRLPAGRWSVDSQASAVVEVVVPGRTLELRGGHVHVEVAADVVHVSVLRGEVVQRDADGRRIAAEVDPGPTDPRRAATSAEDLAREAEVHMAMGRRGEAIKSLRQLVTRYPRSTAAQAGLIDLGRLLERAGQEDRARCAYALFLERWPAHSLRTDVTAAHDALGEGPGCRGLRPRR